MAAERQARARLQARAAVDGALHRRPHRCAVQGPPEALQGADVVAPPGTCNQRSPLARCNLLPLSIGVSLQSLANTLGDGFGKRAA